MLIYNNMHLLAECHVERSEGEGWTDGEGERKGGRLKRGRSDEDVKSLPASGSLCVRAGGRWGGREGPALSVQAESE